MINSTRDKLFNGVFAWHSITIIIHGEEPVNRVRPYGRVEPLSAALVDVDGTVVVGVYNTG